MDSSAATAAWTLAPDATQRWGIIGLGAQADGIARALSGIAGVEIEGCRSSSAARTDEFAATFDCRPYHSEAEFFDAAFEVVVVAGMNAHHAAHCIAAFERESAVLCEKPLTLTRAAAEQILASAEAARRPLFAGYHYRFRPLAREIRDLVGAGEIGDVRDVHMQRTSEHLTSTVRPWRHDLALAGAGVICDVGVHLVDFICWLTGEPVASVGAVADPPRASGRPDEHVVASLELASGALAVVDVARGLPSGDNALQIHGTEGSIFTGPLRWSDTVRVEVRCPGSAPRVFEQPVNAPLREELVAVRDACRGQRSELLATGADGLAGATVLEGVIRSLDSGRRIALAELGGG